MQLRILTWQTASRRANDQLDFFFLASTPTEEHCTEAGGSQENAIIECTAYIHQLIRYNGTPPPGAEFFIIENHHDFGRYWEAGIFYIPTGPEDEEQSESEVYAGRCEIGPDKWDAQALKELRKQGHPDYQQAKIVPIRKTA